MFEIRLLIDTKRNKFKRRTVYLKFVQNYMLGSVILLAFKLRNETSKSM